MQRHTAPVHQNATNCSPVHQNYNGIKPLCARNTPKRSPRAKPGTSSFHSKNALDFPAARLPCTSEVHPKSCFLLAGHSVFVLNLGLWSGNYSSGVETTRSRLCTRAAFRSISGMQGLHFVIALMHWAAVRCILVRRGCVPLNFKCQGMCSCCRLTLIMTCIGY